ncbi:hypothetical protein Q3G72_000139 [Acer saccharum]|nr:hypothetical protein Q3G72_000139 [Acer saccharum]
MLDLPSLPFLDFAVDLAPLVLVAVILFLSLLSFVFIFHLCFKTRKSQYLESFNSLWTVRLLLVSFIILWALNELLRLPFFRKKYYHTFFSTLTLTQQANLCRVHVVLSLGFLEPGCLVILLFLLNASIKKKTPRSSWALALLMVTCLPVFLLQFLFVFYQRFDLHLPKFFIESSKVSSADGEMVLCSYPLLSTILFGAFVTIYCFYFMFCCWTVLSLVINKTLRSRIYCLSVTVLSTIALQIFFLGVSAFWPPEKPAFSVLELVIFLSFFTCTAVGEGIFIIIPITDSLSVSRESFQLNSGFINIDCGASESYLDNQNGLFYESDTKYIDTGEISEIIPNFTDFGSHRRQRYSLRSFPHGKRNCYTLKPNHGANNNYFIRAVFEYGNYDDNDKIPVFDLYLGVTKWMTVRHAISIYEIIHVPSTNYIDVCLVNISKGIPYISALELRPVDNSIYRIPNGALSYYLRDDIGGNNVSRYKVDVYDRLWYPVYFNSWNLTKLPDQSNIYIQSSDYKVPDEVMRAAATVDASSPLSLYFNPPADASGQLYIYFHFAELEELNDGQKRELRIELNGERNLTEPVILEYLKPVTINTTFPPIYSSRVYVSIYAADDSDLPPILNAVEMYEIIELQRSPTNLDDVHAMMKIKSVYGVKGNWQGDPCLPQEHRWDGVICSNDSSNNPPRIISLNLSCSGLTGEIDPSFARLTALQSLYLNGNKLTGLVPADLIKKSKNGSLTLSVEGDPDICLSAASCKKNNKIVVPVVALIAAFSVFLITILVIFWRLKMRKKQATVVLGKSESISENKNDTFAAKKRQFTYSDIVEITKNFETVLGKGGFGTVYHGYLDDTEVAVKLLSSSSAQGYKEFHSEVKLLMRVHHRNLTSLVGYCIEGTHMGIIYEYMAKGSLDQYFSGKHEGKNASILSWEDRMRIAVDAAQGLEYLHDGVVGTPGYLDPE